VMSRNKTANIHTQEEEPFTCALQVEPVHFCQIASITTTYLDHPLL
jgi:hypothetical protein